MPEAAYRGPTSDEIRPVGPLDRLGELFGALTADKEPRPVRQLEAHAPVAAGVEDAFAVAAGADAPAAVVGEGPVLDYRVSADLGDRDHAAVDRHPAEPDADLGRGHLGRHL